MTRPHADRVTSVAGAGTTLTRRELVRLGGAGLLGTGVAGLLSACGRTSPRVYGTGFQIMVASWAPAQADWVHALKAAALRRNVSPGPQFANPEKVASNLRELTASSGLFDAASNSYPPKAHMVVLVAPGLSAVESIAARAMRQKIAVKIVACPTAIRHQSAAVTVDPGEAATLLAQQAARWAHERLGGRGRALLVVPPERRSAYLWSDQRSVIMRTLTQTLAREAPGVTVTSPGTGAGEASSRIEGIRDAAEDAEIVLALDDSDTTIPDLVAGVRRRVAPRERARRFLGVLGSPMLASWATIAELQRGDVLRVAVAARLQEVADALVDLPLALISHVGSTASVRVPPRVLTPGSPLTAAYHRDYAHHTLNLSVSAGGGSLNPSAPVSVPIGSLPERASAATRRAANKRQHP